MKKNTAVYIFLLSLLFGAAVLHAQDTKQNADFKLAVNLFNDKLYDLSLEQFKQFVSNFPGSSQIPDAKFYIGRIYRSLGKRDEARAAFQSFALTYAEHSLAPDAWWNIGEMYADEKKFADAASAFERIKIFHPKSQRAPRALFAASNYFEQANDGENAKKMLRALLDEYPTNELVSKTHVRLGTFYLREKNFLGAKKEFTIAAETGADKETKIIVTLQLGKLAEESGNNGEAEILYKTIAEEKSPLASEAKIALATLYNNSGRTADALVLLKKIIADSTRLTLENKEQTLLLLGNIYFDQKELKKATETFEALLTVTTKNEIILSSLFKLGEVYRLQKNYSKARASYTAALEKNCTSEQKKYAVLQCGAFSLSLKEYSAAVQYFSQWLEIAPSDEDVERIAFRIAELTRVQLQEPLKALELYKLYILKYPHSRYIDDALFGLAQCYEVLGKDPQAIETYDELLQKYPSSDFFESALQRKIFLQQFHKPEQEQSIQQLALLIGDVILEKPKAELAMRLGDMYFSVLQNYTQAEVQYAKAEAVSVDSSMREQASFKRIHAMVRQATLDTANAKKAVVALEEFLSHTHSTRLKDEAEFSLFELQTRNATSPTIIEVARNFLRYHPASLFLPKVMNVYAHALQHKGLTKEAIEQNKKIATKFSTSPEAEDAAANLGIQLAHLGAFDTALVVLQDYLRTYPNGKNAANVLYEKGIALAQKLNYADAVASFEVLQEKFFYTDRAEHSRNELATNLHRAGMFNKAIALYSALLKESESPLNTVSNDELNTAALSYNLAKVYDDAKNITNAKIWYTKYVQSQPATELASLAWLRLAFFAKQELNNELAIRCTEQSQAVQRTVANSSELAALYYETGKYSKAIAAYNELLSLSADQTVTRNARLRIITSLYRIDKTREAEQKIADFTKNFGKDKNAFAEFEFEKTMAMVRAERYDEALSMLKRFPALYDSTAFIDDSYFWTGKIFEITNLPDSAMKYYQLVLRMYPQSELLPKVHLALGNMFFFKENYDEAIKYYRLIVDKPTTAPDILPYAMNNLIAAYKEVGLFDGALALTRTFIERYPNDESIQIKKIDLGFIYQRLGYYDQAVVQLQAMLETANKELESEIRYYLGESLYYKGDYQQAILEFLKVPYLVTKKTKIDWTPNSYYMAGQSYEKMGKYEQALNMYQQIIEKAGVDPAFKAAAQKEMNRIKSIVTPH